VDHECYRVIHDPSLPTAGDDLHPGIEHHVNFAEYVLRQHSLATLCA
jgi:hypothetical protein